MTAREESALTIIKDLLGMLSRTEQELNAICITIVPSEEESKTILDAMAWCDNLPRGRSDEWSMN